MRNNKMLLSVGLLVLSPWASLYARARIVENSGPSCPQASQAPEHCPHKKGENAQGVTTVAKKKLFLHHALSGSLALRWLDVGDISLEPFNGQNIKDITAKNNRDIVLDYSLMYQYRPTPSYSLGLSFDRLQVSSADVDIRYVPDANPPPAEDTWARIASDLNPEGDAEELADTPTAIGNFYHPSAIGNRGYCYEFVARAYVYPSLSFDPFFQVTIGWAHNRAAVHREDGSRTIKSSDKAWTWSVGAGTSYALTDTLYLEPSLQIRDQHKFEFEDTVQSYTTPATKYVLSGLYEKYYSVDFKVTLRQTW